VAMHAANNLVAFGFAIAYDGLADSLLVTEVTPAEGAVSIAGTVVTAAVLLWWARRQRPAVLVPGDVRRDARPDARPDARAEEVAAGSRACCSTSTTRSSTPRAPSPWRSRRSGRSTCRTSRPSAARRSCRTGAPTRVASTAATPAA